MARSRARSVPFAGVALLLAFALAAVCLGATAVAGQTPVGTQECTPLKKKMCKRSTICRWGGKGVRCQVAKDACDAVQGKKMRKKCNRVEAPGRPEPPGDLTAYCACSRNPTNQGKNKGKCVTCQLINPIPPPPPVLPPPPPPVVCGANQYVSSKTCTVCPGGSTNAAGDNPSGPNTTCECAVNQYVSNNVCVPCASGTAAPAGSAVPGSNTQCSANLCAANQRVVSNSCVACPGNTSNAAGDNPSGADTTCDANANFRVQSNAAVACVTNSVNAAGDPVPGVDTTCGCNANFRVQDNACTACGAGTSRAAGDPVPGPNTLCA